LYYSAQAFMAGRDMYGPSAATDLRFAEAPDLRYPNMNLPHLHLLVLPLALLPPNQAITIWMGLNIFALIVSLFLIAHELRVEWTPLRLLLTVFAVLAFAGTEAFFVTGQVSMLLLLAVTLCWLDARHDRWSIAGLWLGTCFSVKPFFLIFAPYLLGMRRFRAIAVGAITAAAWFAVGVLVFGLDSYRSWYGALGQPGDWAWAPMNASVLGLFRRTFEVQPVGTPLVVYPQLIRLWVVAAAAIGVVTLVAALRDTTAMAVDRAFALLLISAQLISPLGWVYYLPIAAGPVGAIVCRPRTTDRVRATNASRALAAIAIVGFAWPLTLLGVGQPHGWATFLITSMYFWATLAAWTWLLKFGRCP